MAHMSVEKIITVGLAIKEAAETARRNKRECRDIERSVARVGALLSVLHSSSATAAAAMRHPALSGPLEDLAESVEEALELVAGCRETGALRRFLAAEGMAKKLRRVQEDVLRKMMLGTFATTTLMSMTLASNAAAPSGGGRHDGTADQHLLPCARAQDAEQVGISDISTDDARAGVSCDCDTTSIIAATASEVPYAPSSTWSRSQPCCSGGLSLPFCRCIARHHCRDLYTTGHLFGMVAATPTAGPGSIGLHPHKLGPYQAILQECMAISDGPLFSEMILQKFQNSYIYQALV